MNKYYSYENFALWYDECWLERLPSTNVLTEWIRLNKKDSPREYIIPTRYAEAADLTALHEYKGKNNSINDPDVIQYWQDRGVFFASYSFGMVYWIALVPKKALENRKNRLPVIMVIHNENHQDPFWAMNTLANYRTYNEMVADGDVAMLYMIPNDYMGENPIYSSSIVGGILQEMLTIYPCDPDRIWLDVSTVYGDGIRLADIPDYVYTDRDGNALPDPDGYVDRFNGIPVLDISKRLVGVGGARSDIISEVASVTTYDCEPVIHSVMGENIMEAIQLEYKYGSGDNPEFLKYWAEKGLKCESHEIDSYQWVSAVPQCAWEEPVKKLPLLLVMQEVSGLMACFSRFHKYCQLAAQGECILVFFALETPDDNDLLADIIKEAAKLYPVDEQRVYVSGFSHNGTFAVEFARRHPDVITAMGTFGISPCFLAPEGETNALSITDEKVEGWRKSDMPAICIAGCHERYFVFPINQPVQYLRSNVLVKGRAATLEGRIEGWQRRLRAACCPVQSDEMVAAAAESPDKTTRVLGIPSDRQEILFVDGIEYYIADYKNTDGNYHLRVVGVEGLPHTTEPFSETLAWSFMRRFARDLETKKIIELY